MRYRRSSLLSQNFVWNRELVSRLIRSSSIGKNDIVLEIGSGKGILTSELLNVANKVFAVELDQRLFHSLETKYANTKNLRLYNQDFLRFQLPSKPYKIFSNIPFRLTGEIIRKLLRAENPPEDTYLIVQEEAAHKLLGKPFQPTNSLVSVLYWPWFEFSVIYNFHRIDFQPAPNVDIVLLRIQKRQSPLFAPSLREIYEDFIVYTFGRTKSNQISHQQWRDKFNAFVRSDAWKQKRVQGAAHKLFLEQAKLHKIHRTRTDRDWRKF